ncbi:MAG: hypothetical protein LBC77_02230 [Spirochaetaceae bacterium]|jgi:hypothetical protein|nr:hypothetical protein [Spirochaetaceae bacterium]
MEKITVLGFNGAELTPTYPKRAKQLVRQGRAAWEGGVLRLLREPERSGKMADYDYETRQNGRRGAEPPELKPGGGDRESVLRTIARRNIQAKKSLIGQTIDFFVFGALSFFIVAILSGGSDELGLFLYFAAGAFWAVRLAFRVIRFLRPSLRGGIGGYFRERRARGLEDEYRRLSALSEERVIDELGRI